MFLDGLGRPKAGVAQGRSLSSVNAYSCSSAQSIMPEGFDLPFERAYMGATVPAKSGINSRK